jgi:lipid A oxidase
MRTSLGTPRAGALRFLHESRAGHAYALAMNASPRRRLFAETLILGCAVLASAGHRTQTVLLPLPFDVYPGGAYLALLALPALFGSDGGGKDGPDVQFAAYAGPSVTMGGTVELSQPGGTVMRFDGVAWDGEPFKGPIYYGYRGFLWPGNARTGVMADFTHIKAMARLDSEVDQSGMRDGETVPPREKLSVTFRKLEFTHGYNFLTLNLVRRAAADGRTLVPYVGAGAGIALPHVEVLRQGRKRNTRTSEYQIAFPAVQVLGGVEWRVFPRFSLFVEYKLTCAAIRGRVRNGGSLNTDLCTHQLIGGPAWHLRARTAAQVE